MDTPTLIPPLSARRPLTLASLCAAALLLALTCAAHAQVGVYASDSAGNYTTWNGGFTPAAGGYGFGSWSITNGGGNGSWGWFLGNSTSNGAGAGNPGINSSGSNASNVAWGIYNNDTNGVATDAYRSIDSVNPAGDTMITGALQPGEIFRQDMDNGYINTGDSVGISIRNSTGQNLFEFYYTGGSSDYTYTTGGSGGSETTAATSLGFNDNGLTLEFALTSSSTYTFSIYSAGSGGSAPLQTVTGSLITETGGETVSQDRIWNYDAGNGSSYDAFFNNMKVKVPTWVGTGSGNFSTGSNWSGAALSGSAVSGASIAFDGGSGLITATNNSLSSVYNISFDATTTPITGGTGLTNATTYVVAPSTSFSSLTVNGGINNNSTNNQTFSTALALGASQTFAATSGGLTFNGAIANGGNTLTTTGASNISFSGGISGAGGLNLNGGGTVTIAGANGYTGATAVNAGVAIISGSITGTTSTTVAAGATLEVDGLLDNATTLSGAGKIQGSGTMGAITANGGTIAPGLTIANSTSATGVLNAAGNVTLSGSTTFSLRVGFGSASSADELASTGSINLNGATLALTLGGLINNPANIGKVYDIVSGGSAPSGTFAGLANGSTLNLSGYTFTVNYDVASNGAGSGNFDTLTLNAIPEPGAWASLISGAAFLIAFRRRRR